MGLFTVEPSALAGVFLLRRLLRGDERGFFCRLFDAEALQSLWPGDAVWQGGVAQINHTFTREQGTVRGVHFQHPPHGEYKLVSCVGGVVHDVALDLRRGSPTFLQSVAYTLSADNACSLLIPPGCAHGLQTLSDNVVMIYAHSMPYRPSADDGVHPLDPRAAINWPLPIRNCSERDRQRTFLPEDFAGLSV